jgi:hypothetical protein
MFLKKVIITKQESGGKGIMKLGNVVLGLLIWVIGALVSVFFGLPVAASGGGVFICVYYHDNSIIDSVHSWFNSYNKE